MSATGIKHASQQKIDHQKTKKLSCPCAVSELTLKAAKGRGPAGIHTFSSILCIELLDNRTGHYLINMTYTRKRRNFKADSAQLLFTRFS